MKTKRSQLTIAILNYLKENGSKTPKELHNYLVEKQSLLYEDILESNYSELQD